MASSTHPTSPNGYPDDFVARVLDDALASDTSVYGIAGLQGTGKSTLSAQVAALAATRGLAATVLSIDDVYLDRPQRLALGREIHPLLATRGPPGTHDVALACSVIDALRQGRATQLPRFDKITDRQLPRPSSRSRRATTRPSPPLFPFPITTRTGPGPATRATDRASPVPARSIRSSEGTPCSSIAHASTARISSASWSGSSQAGRPVITRRG